MKTYQTDAFGDLVFKLTDLFVSLKPPTPSTRARGKMPKVTMRSIMDHNNGCILASCLVETSDGIRKPLASLRKGDVLASGARVECVILSKYAGTLVRLGRSLVITPYHPVRTRPDDEWRFPVDVDEITLVDVDACLVANLLLDAHHVVAVGGVECVTLAHGLDDNDVVKHPYYGTSRVVDDLKRLDGWNDGLVVLNKFRVSRDQNGFVDRAFDHSYGSRETLIDSF